MLPRPRIVQKIIRLPDDASVEEIARQMQQPNLEHGKKYSVFDTADAQMESKEALASSPISRAPPSPPLPASSSSLPPPHSGPVLSMGPLSSAHASSESPNHYDQFLLTNLSPLTFHQNQSMESVTPGQPMLPRFESRSQSAPLDSSSLEQSFILTRSIKSSKNLQRFQQPSHANSASINGEVFSEPPLIPKKQPLPFQQFKQIKKQLQPSAPPLMSSLSTQESQKQNFMKLSASAPKTQFDRLPTPKKSFFERFYRNLSYLECITQTSFLKTYPKQWNKETF